MNKLFLAFFSFFCLSLSAQQYYRFFPLGIEAGLSQNSVNSIIQDSIGFLWIATEDGLNRYDGSQFKTYRNNVTEKTSLTGNTINHLFKDSKNHFWIATNQGLSKLNPSTEWFQTFKNDLSNNKAYSSEVIKSFEDKKGNIWIISRRYLIKLGTQKKEYYLLDSLSFLFNENKNTPLYIAPDNTFWFGTAHGIKIFDPSKKTFLNQNNNPNYKNGYLFLGKRINCIYEDKLGIVWIACNDGIIRYNPFSNTFKWHLKKENDTDLMFRYMISSLYQDNYNRLWIGTCGGGLFIQNTDGEILKLQHDTHNNFSLPDNFIKTIFQDNSGTIWIGTKRAGLSKVYSVENKFIHQQIDSVNLQNSSVNNITSLCEDVNGQVWFGTAGSGIVIKQIKTGKITYLKNNQTNKILPNNYITSIIQDNDENIWIGTPSGFCKIDPLSKQVLNDYAFNDLKVNAANFVNILRHDSYKNIWIGTKGGLQRFNQNTETLVDYNLTLREKGLTNQNIISLAIDSDGNVWVGTKENGVFHFNPATNQISFFVKETGNPNGLCDNQINTIYIQNDSLIWFGTSNGLSKYNLITKRFKTYSSKDGLSNTFIQCVLSDSENNIWISSNKGISRIITSTNSIKNYDLNDGLQGYAFNSNAGLVSKENLFYMGGQNGYNTFSPNTIQLNEFIPAIVFTDIKLFNRTYLTDTVMCYKKKVEINYKEPFTITFSALNFTFSEKNNYRYQLEGYNNQWINNGNINFVTFNDLPPGEYTLKVLGSNNDLVWSNKIASLKIIILPRYYQTTLFKILVVLFILFCIAALLKIRTRTLQNKNKQLLEKDKLRNQLLVQKEELIQKNKSITESLEYARIIQQSILRTDNDILKYFDDSFIYFNPKDIVSGDFYWMKRVNGYLFISVIDCTGHGVPGALMSIAANRLINHALHHLKLEDPGEILEYLNVQVIELFRGIEETHIKDGMDMSLCRFDLAKNELVFSGAFNPIYHIRKNHLEQIRGNRYPIGLFLPSEIDGFSTQKIHLEKGDFIYLFSDGYADQFGGESGKKFKYHRFKELLLNSSVLPLNKQKLALETTMTNWKHGFDQIDDMLIIGLKI